MGGGGDRGGAVSLLISSQSMLRGVDEYLRTGEGGSGYRGIIEGSAHSYRAPFCPLLPPPLRSSLSTPLGMSGDESWGGRGGGDGQIGQVLGEKT